MDFTGRLSHEHAGPSSFPDIMNDPAYDTNGKGKEREHEEQDTCRICRGEATEQDQLYHPCKCSGSIRFVHQPCLVQWLAHSQKKHCELCKTPFHFTKVYDPDMPDQLPTLLFLKQLSLLSLRKVVTWLRWVLVAFVWLGWLPWSMRAIWRALFWLADGRWSSTDISQQGYRDGHYGHNFSVSLGDTTSATSAAAADPSSIAGQPPLEPVPSIFGFSSGEPILLKLMKKAFSTLFFPATLTSFGSIESSNVATTPLKRRPSWLSDVKFLNSLTPSPTINNILIDTLEGQLITLLVVVSFILIFLIREWVVQQQPLDNIAEGEREAADQLIANNRLQAEAPAAEQEQEPEHEHEGVHEEPLSDDDVPEEHDVRDELPRRGTPRLEREIELPNRGYMGFEGAAMRNLLDEGPLTPPVHRNTEVHDGFNFELPSPQRTPSYNQQRSTINMQLYMELYRVANGDYQEMLRLVREDRRYEELSWHVNTANRHGLLSSSRPRSRLSESASFMHADPETVDEAQPAFASPLGPALRNRPSSSQADASHAYRTSPSFSMPLDPDTPEQHDPLTQFSNADSQGNEREPSFDYEPFSENVDNGAAGSDTAVADAESGEDVRTSSENSQAAAEPPASLTKRVFDWFWADIVPDEQNQGPQPEAEDEFAEEPVAEAPVAHLENEGNFDVDGLAADNAAFGNMGVDPNDLDAIEEADDLEGILELIGMQGPIFGLLQNGVFCALLISFTVAAGIWLPYLAGKIALVLLANPIQFVLGVPMTAVSVFADVVLDTLIGSLGYVMYWTSIIGRLLLSPFGSFVALSEWIRPVTSASLSLIDASGQRLGSVVNTFFVFNEADVPLFSVISHHALKIHEARIASLFHLVFLIGKFIIQDIPLTIGSLGIIKSGDDAMTAGEVLSFVRSQFYDAGHDVYTRFFSTPTTWANSSVAGVPAGTATIDYNLAVWDTKDRTIAILMGYLLASAVGLAYLKVARFISGTDRGQRVEGLVAEGLHQAGGVMKVILIIGIEMIVFPLYCGALLDIALLPLFENATIFSRLDFTSTHTLTSLFVHWFIGTCYMFHFALFVSMCRKTMRSGVLYFIRDPDDPTFHPVRDVLERNITTQLRKIAFSALVYGALVIVCLGGVVWGIHYSFDGVLPAHWSSKDPVLEFPIDLLFYNFGIPLAIQALKPSDGLHHMYSWWFRKCARVLRLSDFFFEERHSDEEGGFLSGGNATENGHTNDGDEKEAVSPPRRDGKFVRVPASDQVRIPKGNPVFLEVTETNERVDGKPDNLQGLHGRENNQFTKVYIPSFFRTRIGAFIFLIWMFAAATGVGSTIVPLMIGRKIMSYYVPGRPVNDVYALSAGLGVACAVAGALLSCRAGYRMMTGRLGPYLQSPMEAICGVADVLLSGLRMLYIATAFLIYLPSIFALAIELYLLIPIHTYLGHERDHIIHFVQDWTLGVLYVQMAVKLALWHTRSRSAAVLNGIFRDGWLKPNVKLATRALLIPMTLLAIVAVTLPLSFGLFTNLAMFSSRPELHAKAYRYAYPATFGMGFGVWLVYLVFRQVEVWKVSIRDEFFLIGERLHNFREKRAREVGVPRRVLA
ncbi:E3 ubiquitin-protein ligase SSM4 [Aspergillus stella-maris]|uniref:E3 ubiquitin-protein ligase SSM4 n=1 Tax=Aspergillus stella-maris TaxID=1810926 RepID=UPI003CCD261B